MTVELTEKRVDVDDDWQDIARCWSIRAGTTYLNHGSFGLPPEPVRRARAEWIRQLDEQPMDFFVRQLEPLVERVLHRLARFVGTSRENIVFADNATYAMNVVANSFPISAGDEIILNDHEYGAIHRIWNRRCGQTQSKVVNVKLPLRFESDDQVIETVFERVSENTRIIVISHITSPTAVILPVAKIIQRAKQQGIAVCVDGPHALAQADVKIDELECDFYTASCHKWLCATLGSGFLYAHPKWQERMEPLNKSWGRLLPAIPKHWTEEFTWLGTRDISAFLTIETAIDFMEEIGIERFQKRSHFLAHYARTELERALNTTSMVPDDPAWYGSMAQVPLPAGPLPKNQLQARLWNDFGIEVPIIDFNDGWYIRVSNHLYNSTGQIDKLVSSLKSCL